MSTDTPTGAEAPQPRLDDTTTRTVHETDADVMDNRIVAVETASEAVTLVAFVREGAQGSEVEQALADLDAELTARYQGGGDRDR